MAYLEDLAVKPFMALYDVEGDVMYLSEGRPRPAYTEDDSDGFLWRFSFETKKLCGLTIEAFDHNWKMKCDRLAARLNNRLGLSRNDSRLLAEDLYKLAQKTKGSPID